MTVLDDRQLARIEAVHRGFLYQHLYAVRCLLLAGAADTLNIVVESDEDVQIEKAAGTTYIQIKTRKAVLRSDDVNDALARFETIRREHKSGARVGFARFVIASNAPPDAKLTVDASAWPDDIELHWPDGPNPANRALPKPPTGIVEAIAECNALAEGLPFSLLQPETLTFKLAGIVMLASSGSAPRQDHTFTKDELPDLFEQLVVQTHELPSPPQVYRPQTEEPPFATDNAVRIVAGLSGAGKTAWASQAATLTPFPVVYLDVADTPGPALAAALTREVAAQMFGGTGGGLGQIFLPGAAGLDSLGALSVKLGEQSQHAMVVIDNAHRLPSVDLKTIIERAPNFRFLLLCQPTQETDELQAILGISAEGLGGWTEDTIAEAARDAGCAADYAECERLSRLTGGLPFYVLSALSSAAREYGGSIGRLCSDVESQTHVVALSQEIILKRAFDGLEADHRTAISALGVADVALSPDEAAGLLRVALNLNAKQAAAMVRQLPRSGFLELFGNAGLKVHDAVRPLGHAHLSSLGIEFEQTVKDALRSIIVESIQRDWSVAKLALLVRLFGQLGDNKILVEFATDELFHEMGVWPEIEPFLVATADDESSDPETRLWALDGLAFNYLRVGHGDEAARRIEAMEELLSEADLGPSEWLAWAMKRMLELSNTADRDGAFALMDQIEQKLPNSHEHRRIFRYNRALAHLKLGDFAFAVSETEALKHEYYSALGISPEDVILRNPRDLRPLLKKGKGLTDNLKHLADTLELNAVALERIGRMAPMGRLYAMKFYELAQAPQSYVRVGQDYVDECVRRRDFISAREVIENALLPMIQAMGLVAWVVPVRSQYAVVLAYSGDHGAAADEMRRLAPYEASLSPMAQAELRAQRELVANLRRHGPPPQLQVTIPGWLSELQRQRKLPHSSKAMKKVGRNELCPCSSGRKYKHCHGR